MVACSREAYHWKEKTFALADKLLLHVPQNGNWLLIKKNG